MSLQPASRVRTAPNGLIGLLSGRHRGQTDGEGRGGGGERGGGRGYTHTATCETASQREAAAPRGEPRSEPWDGPGLGRGGGREAQGGGDLRVHTADSHRWTAGTNSTLPSSYVPITKRKIAAEILKKKKRFLSFTIIVLALDILMGGCGGGWGGQWEGLGRKSPL